MRRIAALLVVLALPSAAAAQVWPAKPIRIKLAAGYIHTVSACGCSGGGTAFWLGVWQICRCDQRAGKPRYWRANVRLMG